MPKVIVMLLGKTPQGWRRGHVSLAKNGLPKPGLMLMDGEEVPATNLTFQVREYKNRQAVYTKLPASMDYREAVAIADRRQKKLEHEALEVELGIVVKKTPDILKAEEDERKAKRKTLAQLKPDFIDKFAHGSDDTIYNYTYTSEQFIALMTKRGKLYPEDLNEDDVIAFDRHLEGLGNKKSTRAYRYGYVRCFLTFIGREPNKLISATEHKKLKKKPTLKVEQYTIDELEKLYEASSPRHRLIWRCYTMLGLREEELAFALWAKDVNFQTHDWTVRFKARGSYSWSPELEWTTKDYEERDIPIPDELFGELEAWRKANPADSLVFPTRGGQSDIKLLKALKSDWRRAGLNCGHCEGCYERQECSRAKIKTFRSTYLTHMSGFTKPQNLMLLAGQSSIETTMKYLAVDKDVRSAANTAFAPKADKPKTMAASA